MTITQDILAAVETVTQDDETIAYILGRLAAGQTTLNAILWRAA